MYLIVGLGNPEEEYARTRHNMGFDAINQIAQDNNISLNKKKFSSIYGTGEINGEKVILLKPQTYMNLSGKAIREVINFYKIKQENLIVIYDDIDIQLETIKIKKKGTAGTHNGMKSVISEIKTEEFCRIKIGIGEPEYKGDLLNYLLTRIPNEEYELLAKSINKVSNAVADIIKNGIDHAMNKYN